MSSLAPASDAADARARRAGHPPRRVSARVTGDSLLGLALAAALCLLAFTTTGGSLLAPNPANTWAQIALLLIGAGLGAAVMVRGGGERLDRPAAVALLAFAALAAVTFASIAWSVQPAYSWLEANLTLSYLAAFVAAIALARLAGDRGAAVVSAIALYTLVVSGYALLTKVFPASLNAGDSLGRLRAPFDYYNAIGIVAASGLPAWLWLGAARGRLEDAGSAALDPGAGRGSAAGDQGASRAPAAAAPGRAARRALTILTVPALAVLVCALVLSYGRGALLAGALGLAVWLVLVPARLRAVLLLGLGVAGGGVVSAWATGQHAISHNYASLPDRVTAGHHFGLVLVVALVVLSAAGAGAAWSLERVRLSALARRRIGTGLVALLGLIPVAAVLALATSSRGFGGEVSHLWSSLTSPHSTVFDTPNRLAQLGSSRPRYWSDGLTVGGHAPLAGTGAFGFAVATKRYSADNVTNAHSYVIQTFADLGLVGLAVSAVLLIAWALSARRALLAADGPRAGPRRAVAATLLATVVIFGVHSGIDWTWFIPGAAVPPLLCAGWLLGRSRPRSSPAPGPPGADPLRVGAAVGLVALALLGAWIVWQPLRSANASAAALDAMLRGDAGAALTDARTAARTDPVDAQPHELLSEIDQALGDQAAARRELVKATDLQPSNPVTWNWLAGYDQAHGRAADAARERARAAALDPYAAQRIRR